MGDLQITNRIRIPLSEIELIAIRSQGSGGQNINKVATGIHLRFNIICSSLPVNLQQRLLQLTDHRISKDGVIIIKSQQSRSQDQNRNNALALLQQLIKKALITRKIRKQTKPSRSAREKRLQQKSRRSETKSMRQKITE